LKLQTSGASWTCGPGVPVATLSASAEQLLLVLWGRMSGTDTTLIWDGDRRAGLAILSGTLTP
jgi:hypothetical protein